MPHIPISALLLLLGLTACSSTRPTQPAQRTARDHDQQTPRSACDYAILTGADVAQVARGYEPRAVMATLSTTRAEQLLAALPGMLGTHLTEAPGPPDPDLREMQRRVRAGEYHAQFVPFTVNGRPRVLINMLDHTLGGKYWLQRYYTICDGGANNGFCIIDLETEKILMAHCNGYG